MGWDKFLALFIVKNLRLTFNTVHQPDTLPNPRLLGQTEVCFSFPPYSPQVSNMVIEDYDKAKKNADRACALSGGPYKMVQELIGVYSRIKAETK